MAAKQKMIIGVPKEIKTDEYRVAMIPVGVEELTRAGHQVLIQTGAGQGSGISDDEYAGRGAEMVADPSAIWKRADLIVKVKEPLPQEWPLLQKEQIVFTYFHFAADRPLTEAVLQSGITAIAYETIKDARGNLPLLTPMSEVAGRMSIQEGAKFLERPFEGRGILLGGVPGVLPANVVILGGVLFIADAAPLPRPGLDQHLMPQTSQFLHAHGDHGHPVLVGLDFLGHADDEFLLCHSEDSFRGRGQWVVSS